MESNIKEIVQDLEKKLIQQQAKYSKYRNYYMGKHDILNSHGWETRNNTVEIHNFCKQFIDNNTGFLLGNNIQMQYNSPDKDYNIVNFYNDSHLGNKAQQLDQKLLRDMQIYGVAYEIDYINKDGEFDFTIKTPLEVAVERIGNKVVYGLFQKGVAQGVKHYTLFLVREGKVIDLTVTGGHIKIVNVLPNDIDNPIIVVYNNWEQQSEMEDILTLQDAYNQVSSDATSEINDFRNAYMYFKGMTLNEEVLEKMNKSGIITSKSEGADVKFITKEINSDFIEKKLDQLEHSMYNTAGQVNFNDAGIGSNTSSLALRNKLTNLINKLKLKEGFLKESLHLRMKNLSKYLTIVDTDINEEMINPNFVDVSFILNIPTSDKETSEMIIELYNAGLLSMESAISQLSFINKVDDEIEKIQQEKVEEGAISLEEIFVDTGDVNEETN